jgi:Cu+-exporting ATPase
MGADLFLELDHATMGRLWLLEGCVSLGILLGPGFRFTEGAWHLLRSRRANMDTLIALGTWSAWLYSTAVVLSPALQRRGGMPYYDGAGVVIALVLLGQWFETRARGRASSILEELEALQRGTATVLRGGVEERIPLGDVQVGDLLVVRPGDMVPVDATVEEGRSAVDESRLTGESLPVTKAPGAPVFAGTINTTGSLRCRALRLGRHSAVAQIAEAVRKAQGSRPPVARLVDRVSAVFVPGVMILAVLTFLAWYDLGGPGGGLEGVIAAASVLLIACPCALGLATPLSISVGVEGLARRGALVRDGADLEGAARADCVVLDKTGTLTAGRPAVVEVLPHAGWTEEALLGVAAAVEAPSEHPLARAIVEKARERGLSVAPAEDFVASPGEGVSARVGGKRVRAGSPAYLQEEGSEFPDGQALVARGASPIGVAVSGEPAGLLGLADPVRPEGPSVVSELGRLGLEVWLVTGDAEAPAEEAARSAGVRNVKARVRPEGKADFVRTLQERGRVVAMVGDGLNDAPALSQADAGFAMGSGTDFATASAGITLLGGRLAVLPGAIRAARATMRNIRQNLWGAFAYNLVALVLATGALVPALGPRFALSPLVAGLAMSLSSATVVLNAQRLRRTLETSP